MTELSLVRSLAKRLPRIGDDCAIVRHGGEDLLFTTDLLVEDVHFRREERSAADIGYRALARSLSDMPTATGSPVTSFRSRRASWSSKWIWWPT